MDVIGLLVMFGMAVVGSLIARKFKTREKSAEWFDSLKLDWITGIGLAFVIVLLPVVLMLGCLHAGIIK